MTTSTPCRTLSSTAWRSRASSASVMWTCAIPSMIRLSGGTIGLSLSLQDLGHQRRDYLEQIADNPIIGHFKNRRVGVLVDGHNDLRSFHPHQVLNRAGNSHRDVHLGRHRLTGAAHLPLHRQPAVVADRT